MTEREEALKLADKLLEEPFADPDDDLRMLSRQLLRRTENNAELLKFCKGALNALRSYQYGNASPDLAKEIADHLENVIAKMEGGARNAKNKEQAN